MKTNKLKLKPTSNTYDSNFGTDPEGTAAHWPAFPPQIALLRVCLHGRCNLSTLGLRKGSFPPFPGQPERGGGPFVRPQSAQITFLVKTNSERSDLGPKCHTVEKSAPTNLFCDLRRVFAKYTPPSPPWPWGGRGGA